MAEVISRLPSKDPQNYIEVETLDNRSLLQDFRDFSLTTIGKIKTILEWEFGCEIEHIRLMFQGFKLQQDDKTLSPQNAKLQLTLAIPGSGMANTSKILFTDITRYNKYTDSLEGLSRRTIGKVGPRYHMVILVSTSWDTAKEGNVLLKAI